MRKSEKGRGNDSERKGRRIPDRIIKQQNMQRITQEI